MVSRAIDLTNQQSIESQKQIELSILNQQAILNAISQSNGEIETLTGQQTTVLQQVRQANQNVETAVNAVRQSNSQIETLTGQQTTVLQQVRQANQNVETAVNAVSQSNSQIETLSGVISESNTKIKDSFLVNEIGDPSTLETFRANATVINGTTVNVLNLLNTKRYIITSITFDRASSSGTVIISFYNNPNDFDFAAASVSDSDPHTENFAFGSIVSGINDTIIRAQATEGSYFVYVSGWSLDRI